MNRMTDRKRLRREYLKRKASAYTQITIGGVVFFPSLIAAFLCAAMTVVFFISAIEDRWPLVLIPALVSGLLAVFFTWSARKSNRAVSYGRIQARIPYVPPVTANTLPADEILVRGSEEPPVAQSGVLLRAAQAGQETAKAELLRVSRGE